MASISISNRNIRGVVFDWGDTLIHPPGMTTDVDGHFSCVEAFFLADLPKRFPAAGAVDNSMWQAFRHNYERVAHAQIQETFATGNEHSFEERFARVLAATFAVVTAPDEADLAWMAERFGERVASECWQIANAETVLSQLARIFRIGLLSNYPHAPAVHASLERFGLLIHMDTVAVSGDIGWAKPDARAFDHIIAAIGLPPEHLLYVGDDIVNDMQGAKAVGMATAWLPRRGQGESQAGPPACVDVTITGLTDLVDLLDNVDGMAQPS